MCCSLLLGLRTRAPWRKRPGEAEGFGECAQDFGGSRDVARITEREVASPFLSIRRSPPPGSEVAALRSIWSPSSPALQHCHRSGQGLDEAQSRPPPESTARAAWAWKERQRDGRRKGRPGARGTQVGPRGRGFRDEVTPAIVACLQAHGQCMSLPPCVAGGACRMSPPPPHRLAKDDPPTNAQRPPIYA